VVGFVPDGKDDFVSLIIAAQVEGELACVGKFGSGFDRRLRERINAYLWGHLRSEPVVWCGKLKGNWLEPGLYCTVRCMERTSTGQLRAPVIGDVYGA
jgi:ATP-dependent DNA ligase